MTAADLARAAPRQRVKIRWWIFTFLFAFTMVAYVQRTAISVAAERIMPEQGLDLQQIAWLETAFLVSYTALQFPGGVLGEVLGPRRMLTLCGALAVLATIAFPLLPGVLTGTPLFWGLLCSQAVLGIAQSPLFAMVSGGFESWFPRRQWALTQGLSSSGIGLGSAVAPAVIASLMVMLGWQAALLLAALPAIALLALWWQHGRDTPAQHPAVQADERAELDAANTAAATKLTAARFLRLLINRDLLGLTLSYAAMNYVFYLITYWSFLYLVQERHWAVVASGLAAALPQIAGAIGAALGGIFGSRLTALYGARIALRAIPLTVLPASGVMLLIGVHAGGAVGAVAGLSLGFLLLEMTEAPFWAAGMEIGRQDAVAACAILNTGGNLGGIVATPLVGMLSAHGHWTTPFTVGVGFAVFSASLWLWIDPAPDRAPLMELPA